MNDFSDLPFAATAAPFFWGLFLGAILGSVMTLLAPFIL